jgi:hypothetical protein
MPDARIDPAALRESDLPAFRIAVERGHPGSVMCAYNKVNGEYSCGNSWLLDAGSARVAARVLPILFRLQPVDGPSSSMRL